MRILALDTSTWRLDAALVAVMDDGSFETLAEARHETGKGMHSRLLPGLLLRMLEERGVALAELDGMTVGLGPGSFTGLRTGMATLRAMAYAAGVSLGGASSLASMALSAWTVLASEQSSDRALSPLLVPVLDARRSQVYAGFYRVVRQSADHPSTGGTNLRVAPELFLVREEEDGVMAPLELLSLLDRRGEPAVVFGSGLEADSSLAGDARARPGIAVAPSAVELARLAAPALGAFDLDQLLALRPTYVRQRVVDVTPGS